MNKKAKKIILPIVLVLVLAGLIIGYVFLKKSNEAANAAENEELNTDITVLSKSPAIPVSISLSNEKDDLSLTYSDEGWYWTDDAEFPLNNEKATAIADALSEFIVKATVENPGSDLSAYGLTEPYLTAKCEFSDGTNYTYTFGIVNSFNKFRYCTVTGDSNVYMIDNTITEILNIELDDLFQKEKTPLIDNTVVADNVSKIVIFTEGGQKSEITDEEGIADLFELIYSLNLSDWEDYHADESSMLENYGIGESCTKAEVTYTTEENVENGDGTTSNVDVEHVYTVYIGHRFENEDGTSGYFYTMEGSDIVYAANAETVENIMEYLTYVPTPSEETYVAE